MKQAFLFLGVMLMAPAVWAGELEKQMVAESATRCMGIPSVDKMTQTAEAMKLPLVKEEGSRKDEGYYGLMRSWLLAGDSKGPFMWSVSEMNGPKGFILGCDIVSFSADSEALRKELRKGKPTSTDVFGPLNIEIWTSGRNPQRFTKVAHGAIPGENRVMTMLSVGYQWAQKPAQAPGSAKRP